MDADGLPLIGPSVDYQQVEPINQKKTVEYLNHFIVHTAGFLNRFSTVCEEKLVTLSTRIERLHTQMSLLEGKINSIPGLENVTAQTPAATSQPSAQPPATVTDITHSSNHQPPAESENRQAQEPSISEPSRVEETPISTVAQDPRYAKFFKMLTVGIPMMAVKQKMSMEGLNPDLLATPTAALPTGDAAREATEDSDEDFSNEDEDSDSVTFSD